MKVNIWNDLVKDRGHTRSAITARILATPVITAEWTGVTTTVSMDFTALRSQKIIHVADSIQGLIAWTMITVLQGDRWDFIPPAFTQGLLPSEHARNPSRWSGSILTWTTSAFLSKASIHMAAPSANPDPHSLVSFLHHVWTWDTQTNL